MNLEDASELTLRETPPELANSWVEPLNVTHRERAATTRGCRDQLPRFINRAGDRFLDAHVQLPLQRRETAFKVMACGSSDNRSIQTLAIEHLTPGGIRGHAILLCDPCCDLRAGIADRHSGRVLHVTENAQVI